MNITQDFMNIKEYYFDFFIQCAAVRTNFELIKVPPHLQSNFLASGLSAYPITHWKTNISLFLC